LGRGPGLWAPSSQVNYSQLTYSQPTGGQFPDNRFAYRGLTGGAALAGTPAGIGNGGRRGGCGTICRSRSRG
jgi:hypothetical protein